MEVLVESPTARPDKVTTGHFNKLFMSSLPALLETSSFQISFALTKTRYQRAEMLASFLNQKLLKIFFKL